MSTRRMRDDVLCPAMQEMCDADGNTVMTTVASPSPSPSPTPPPATPAAGAGDGAASPTAAPDVARESSSAHALAGGAVAVMAAAFLAL